MRSNNWAKAMAACSLQKRRVTASGASSITVNENSNSYQPPPIVELQWPPTPVSIHTNNIRLNLMNEVPKDLHTARLIIEELRTKVRFQTEHILKWRKAYAMQMQLHYRYQREKNEQLSGLTSQLLLLESRLKRKQKQIGNLLNHREVTIQRQQKIIDTLSSRMVDHGLEVQETTSYIAEIDSLNDSDSAVVLEDVDSDNNMTLSLRRRSSSGGSGFGSCSGDGITVVRSISDAIEATSFNKYAGVRRNTCFLRRPDILETVYSVEEDPEPSLSSEVAEKRDKFKNRSDKIMNSSSTEGQTDGQTHNTLGECSPKGIKTKDFSSDTEPLLNSSNVDNIELIVPILKMTTTTSSLEALDVDDCIVKSPLTSYNRVMTNHRSVTKPKDVKYKRINKAKSRSLEELRGRLKNLVERGPGMVKDTNVEGVAYRATILPHTAQSYA